MAPADPGCGLQGQMLGKAKDRRQGSRAQGKREGVSTEYDRKGHLRP